MAKNETAAVVTINGPGLMPLEERKAVAEWLRSQARRLVKDGKKYTDSRFTARYLYP